MRVTDIYLQSYKYLHQYRNLILNNILQFSADYKKKAKTIMLFMLPSNNGTEIKKIYINIFLNFKLHFLDNPYKPNSKIFNGILLSSHGVPIARI